MADWDGEFIFFQGIQIRTNIIIDISMSIRPMTTKFGKKVYLQDLTKMKLAGAGDVLTSRSRDKLKSLYLKYQSVYGHHTWYHGNLSW